MFCNQCGKPITINDKFCGWCGVLISRGQIEHIGADIGINRIPVFGNCHSKWWGEKYDSKPFQSPYGWLCDINTLFVFDKHFVIIRGGISINRTVSGTDIPGVLGGALGAAISVKNRLIRSTDMIDAKEVLDLYNGGNLIWGSKQTSEIWVIKGKRVLGIGQEQPERKHALFCRYNSLLGELDFLFPLVETDVYPVFSSPIDNLGCTSVIKANVKTLQESRKSFNELFKDFPGISKIEM